MPLYRSSCHSPLAAEWSPPSSPYLWAWFKVDEGSGTTIIDYSGLENGTLVNWSQGSPNATQQNYFWNTTPGFGTQSGNATTMAKVYRVASFQRYTKYMSALVFVKPITQNIGPNPSYQNWCMQAGEDGTSNYVAVGWRDASEPTPWWNECVAFSSTHSPTWNTWYCIYAFSERATTNTGMYVRESGGAFTSVLSGYTAPSGTTFQTKIQSCNTNSYNNLVIGDIMVWADNTNIGGIITLTDANNIYTQLKSRYGMT